MRVQWVVVAMLVAGHAGCGGCDDGESAGPDTTWISDGTGEPNSAPLQPLIVGIRGSNLTIDAVIPDGTRLLTRLQATTTPINAATRLHDAVLLGEGADGVLLYGYEHDRYERPVLWVPTTVRMGMRWRVHTGDRPDAEFEVTQHYDEGTPLGSGSVWQITEYDASGAPIGYLDFLEGYGLYKTPGTVFTPFVVPIDDTGATAQAPVLTPTPLALYTLPGTYYDNLALMTVGLVVPPGTSTGTLIVKGWRSCKFAEPGGQCLEETCFDAGSNGAPFGSAPMEQNYHQGNGCVQHTLTDGSLTRVEITSDASGALVQSDGVRWVPRTRNGDFVDAVDSQPIAVYVNAANEARLLAYNYNGLQELGRHPWTTYAPQGNTFLETDPPLLGQWVGPELGAHETFTDHRPMRSATLSAPGQPADIALLTNQNVLMYSRIEGDTITSPVGVSAIGGATSVTSTANGHALVVASPGGRIDRIVRDPDGTLAREAIGMVTPPAGEQVVAALDLDGVRDGELLIVTWQPAAPDNMDVQGNNGRVAMYTTAKQTPVRWELPRASGVTVEQRVRDVVVCWPPTSAPLETTGWTLGGAAARQVIATGDHCALVVRDVTTDPVMQGQSFVGMTAFDAGQRIGGLRFDVEGPIPGVGRVHASTLGSSALEVVGPDGPTPAFPIAELTGGGFASSRRLFGPGGVTRSVPANAHGATIYGPGIADRAGAGLWAKGPNQLMLIAPSGRTIALPGAVNNGSQWFADPNGGVIVLVGSTWYRATAAGALDALPAPLSGMTYQAVRRTGELCGPQGNDLVCINGTTGVETGRTTVVGNTGIAANLSDDSLLVNVVDTSLNRSTLRWVPGSAPFGYTTGTTISSANYGLDGIPYCVTDDGMGGNTAHTAGICATSGFQTLDLSIVDKTGWLLANVYKDTVAVVPGTNELWIHRFGCTNQCGTVAIRIPR